MSLRNHLRYKLLRLELFWAGNFGKNKFGGFQLFRLHVVPQANVKCEYILNQYYNTREIWKVRTFFVLIANNYE